MASTEKVKLNAKIDPDLYGKCKVYMSVHNLDQGEMITQALERQIGSVVTNNYNELLVKAASSQVALREVLSNLSTLIPVMRQNTYSFSTQNAFVDSVSTGDKEGAKERQRLAKKIAVVEIIANQRDLKSSLIDDAGINEAKAELKRIKEIDASNMPESELILSKKNRIAFGGRIESELKEQATIYMNAVKLENMTQLIELSLWRLIEGGRDKELLKISKSIDVTNLYIKKLSKLWVDNGPQCLVGITGVGYQLQLLDAYINGDSDGAMDRFDVAKTASINKFSSTGVLASEDLVDDSDEYDIAIDSKKSKIETN